MLRKGYTPEEKAAYIQEQREKLSKYVEDLAQSWEQKPEDLAEFLRMQSRFPAYSPRNTALLYAQNPHTAFVGSYGLFEKMGYHIRKGERGLKIMMPVKTVFYRIPGKEWRRLSDASEETKRLVNAGALDSRETISFRIGTVFAIEQTTCPRRDYPKLIGLGYDSGHHALVYGAAKEYAQALGMPVREADFGGSLLRGLYFSDTRHIEINSLLGDTQKVSTLLHELSHGLLEHGARPMSVAQKEFEADALSILLTSHFGLEITDTRREHLANAYRAYRPEWAEGETVVDRLRPVTELYAKHIKPLSEQVEKTLAPVRKIEQAPPRRISLASENYRRLQLLFPKVMDGTYSFQLLENVNGDPLTLERIGKDELALTHAQVVSGELQREPEMTMRVNPSGHIVQPLTYRQDSTGVSKETGVGLAVDQAMHRELNETLFNWLRSTEDQHYTPIRATRTIDGEQVEEDFSPITGTRSAAERGDRWLRLDGNHMSRPRLFVDMDGTLARFHDQENYLERMYEPGFFEHLAPFENSVAGIRQFVQEYPDVEIYILSSGIRSDTCIDEKNIWLDAHLPEIDEAHRIFVPTGEEKTEFIPGGVRSTDILLDDYSHNLEQWQSAGGYSIKLVNNINDQGRLGRRWDGERLRFDAEAPAFSALLAERMGMRPPIVPVQIPEKAHDAAPLERTYRSFYFTAKDLKFDPGEQIRPDQLMSQDVEYLAANTGAQLFRRACPDLTDDACRATGSEVGRRVLEQLGLSPSDGMSLELEQLLENLSDDERSQLEKRLKSGTQYLMANLAENRMDPTIQPSEPLQDAGDPELEPEL